MTNGKIVEYAFLLKDKITESLKRIGRTTKQVENKTEKLKKSYSKLEQLSRKCSLETYKFNRKLREIEHSAEKAAKKTEYISKFGQKIKSIGQGLTVGVTLPIIAAGGAMVKLASDMEETINKVDVSFGNNSDRVKEWAKTSIKSMGLAQQSALDSAALYGDMATGMGMSQEKAADMAMSLTQLGADLASFKNISNDVAQTALKSIFTGETESLKNLGIVMTEANLQNFAYSKGIKKKLKDMKDLEKIQLRYNYVMSQTTNAQGDFIRTGGGAANQTRMFQEQMKELGVTFGTYILPYFTKVISKLNGLLKGFNSLSPTAKKTILVIGGIAAAIGPLITIIGALTTAISGIGVALAFLSANPIVLFFVGLAAAVWGVIKAIEWLIKKINELNGKKISSLNLKDDDNLEYLKQEREKIGAKAFNEKYDRKTQKAVTNYSNRQSSIVNNNNTKTTINNYYGNNITPQNSGNNGQTQYVR